MTRTIAPRAQRAAAPKAARRIVAPSSHPNERLADRLASSVVSRFDPNRVGVTASLASAGAVAGVAAPQTVDDVLDGPGEPLDGGARAFAEPRFGRDFSNVRIHRDREAQRSAADIGALAYASGNHIVLGRGAFAPETPRGMSLLAHELAHVSDRAERIIWRKTTVDLNDFDSGNFADATLTTYLEKLRDTGKIEDNSDSDDKARGVVRKWLAGGDAFSLEPDIKVLLIKEMQSGFTGNDDERAILNLLEKSAWPDIEAMFSAGQLDPDDLDSDFQGDEEDVLRDFYDRRFKGGRKAALAGKATGFTQQPESKIGATYSHVALRTVIDEWIARLSLLVRDRQPDAREGLIDTFVREEAGKLEAQLALFSTDDQAIAGQDLAADRAKKDAQATAIDNEIEAAATQQKKDALGRQKLLFQGEVLLLDLTLEAVFRDVAMASPAKKKDFQKLTTPLDAKTKQAAKDAIAPQTAAAIQAEATGAPPPPPPAFKPGPLSGETDTYEDKVRKRIPGLITKLWDQQAKNRTAADHSDPKKSRSMKDMQKIANQAKDEVDQVFGSFYDKGKFTAFQGDKRNVAGKLTKKGNLRDAWQVEEDRRKASSGYEKQSAKFWLFYLIQNDHDDPNAVDMAEINTAHDATPAFGDDSAPLNDEAKAIRKAGDPFVTSEKTRLFEIGRGWDAFEQSGDIFIQLFKNPNATQDRVFLWDMYLVLMHEYLHKLAAKKYHDYAEKLGGEHSTQGNTLIEGVDSLLTEIAWSSAVQHASTPAVRAIVEPDAVATGAPFDIDLLPKMPARRYANFDKAVKLTSVVGIRNLYAAYFQGRIDLIGGA
ncbi:MAG: DUF4157 domain-containing protein [Phyllobacterium sp.]|uniref:eCIS core domain-containing protein n=1 Tax=Phyllobacterium sp. TaxID=1871046 RepID=UPI0030F179AA